MSAERILIQLKTGHYQPPTKQADPESFVGMCPTLTFLLFFFICFFFVFYLMHGERILIKSKSRLLCAASKLHFKWHFASGLMMAQH